MEFVNTFDSSPNYNIDEHMPALTQKPDLYPTDAPYFKLWHGWGFVDHWCMPEVEIVV